MRKLNLNTLTIPYLLAVCMTTNAQANIVCRNQKSGIVIKVEEKIQNESFFNQRSIYQVGINGNILVSNAVLVKKVDDTHTDRSLKRIVSYGDTDSMLKIVAHPEMNFLEGRASGTYWKKELGTPTPINPTGEYYSLQKFEPQDPWSCQE